MDSADITHALVWGILRFVHIYTPPQGSSATSSAPSTTGQSDRHLHYSSRDPIFATAKRRHHSSFTFTLLSRTWQLLQPFPGMAVVQWRTTDIKRTTSSIGIFLVAHWYQNKLQTTPSLTHQLSLPKQNAGPRTCWYGQWEEEGTDKELFREATRQKGASWHVLERKA